MVAPSAPPDPSLALSRHVEPVRHRRRWWWALAGTAAANAALTLGLGARSSTGGLAIAIHVEAAAPAAPPPVPVVIVQAQAAPTAIVPVVAGPPAPFADLGPCPAPHPRAPTGELTQPTFEPLRGVATSPTDSRRVAAWPRDQVFVSADAGHTWRGVLAGDGRVLDVAFDCHGRPLALRAGGGLGVVDDGREVWRAVPGLALTLPEPDGDADAAAAAAVAEVDDTAYRPRLVGGGRAIAIVGATTSDEGDRGQRVVITDDVGVSWRSTDLGWYEGKRLPAAWTGDTLRVAVPWTDCSVEGINLVTISPRATRTDELREYASDLALAGGAVIARSYDCAAPGDDGGDRERELCVWRGPRRGWTPMAVPASGDADLTLLDGPRDVVIAGDAIYPIGAKGVGRGRSWSSAWHARAVDLAGRVWGLDQAGQLVRG